MSMRAPQQPFVSGISFGLEERLRRLELMLKEHAEDYNIHTDPRTGQMETEYTGGNITRSILYSDSTRTTKLWEQTFTYVSVLGIVDKVKFDKTVFYRNGKPICAFIIENEYDAVTGSFIRSKTRKEVQGV